MARPPTALLRPDNGDGETSAEVAKRVARAWRRQLQRSGICNARLAGRQLEDACKADDQCWDLLATAAEQFNLSARAHQRVLKVARTIADLAQVKKIAPPHVAEALSLRCFDRRS